MATKKVIQIGAGSYSQTEYQNGLLGGAEYARANMESDLVRSGNQKYFQSVRKGDTTFSQSALAPPKPAAVSLSGYDMFGPESLGATTRNMSLDLRGEVVSASQASKAAPPPMSNMASQRGVDVGQPLSTTLTATIGNRKFAKPSGKDVDDCNPDAMIGGQAWAGKMSKSPYGFGASNVNYAYYVDPNDSNVQMAATPQPGTYYRTLSNPNSMKETGTTGDKKKSSKRQNLFMRFWGLIKRGKTPPTTGSTTATSS